MREIQKHNLKWLCVEHGEYAELRYTKSREELGDIFIDMLDMGLKREYEPIYQINDRTLAHSHMMWDEYLRRGRRNSSEGRERYLKLKLENQALKGEGGAERKPDPELFALEGNEYPTREEAAAYAARAGGRLGGEWHDWSVAHSWTDKSGDKIRNWKRACLSYERTHNPDFKQKEET